MVNIEDMSFGYNGGLLFEGLNLKLEKGSIYGLLGLNGAGKTSLLKLISGLLFPKSGRIRVMGENPSRRPPGLLSQIIVLPEELNTPSISEREFTASRSAFYPKFDHTQFERFLQEFDIPRNRKLNKLSFGQKKKFLLSFGLASGSELLVLDEPTNGLDIPSKVLFRSLVAEALTEERIFIISTHQVRDVDPLIDSITILHEGKVLFEESMADVQKQLHMTQTHSPPAENADGLIYSQAVVGGYWAVWSGADEDGSPVDLEILFNTVIARPDIVGKLLSREGEAV